MKLAMRALMVLALAGLGLACSEDKKVVNPDPIPPAAIENLVAGGPTSFTVGLLWTAVGDDSLTGTADHYDIRYSLTPITEASFGKAARATGVRKPEPSGKPDNFTVSGLNANTLYYFAIKAVDRAGNLSPLSNVVSQQTELPPDETPPARVTNLAVADSTPFTVTLVWTEVGDDSTTGAPDSVDCRFSIGLITESNFGSAAEAIHFTRPKAAGQPESLVVTGLRDTTRYYFSLRVADEANNWSQISNVVSTRTLIREQVPPAPIVDLTILDFTFGTARLGWTAPGDDGDEGTAFQYDVRYSTIPITEGNWLRETTKIGGRPKPKAAGSAEEFTVRNLQGSTLYYFAVRTLDEVANMSGISNLVSCTTLVAPDTVPPIRILFLNVADSTRNSVTLTWLTPGDDGTLGQATTYDIRYNQASITEANWDASFQAAILPVLQQPGGNERYTVTGLKPNTRYYFAIKTADEVPNWSQLSQVATAFTSD
ncbi:MAG: fibronectin type III domain-containing protein [Candidatus Zixiibacteriota bacterium]